MRTTTGNDRLNHLMLMHVHQEMTDKIDLKTVANEFINTRVESRKKFFGQFP